MKTIKIPKDLFKDLNYEITLPTFKCKVCGKDVPDTPSNWHLKA